jgi:ATPase family AAA domain-containing protein 3A/B
MSALWGLLLLSAVTSCLGNYLNVYTDVVKADTADSLERIKRISLSFYEYKYDSVTGRKQLGVVGEEVRKYFPEAIEIVPNYPIPTKDRNKAPEILQNFPIVDKNVLFMHGLAALQELLTSIGNIQQQIDHINEEKISIINYLDKIHTDLNDEIDQQLLEQQQVSLVEMELAKKELELLELQSIEAKRAFENELVEHQKMLDYENELAAQRLRYQEELHQQNIKRSSDLEKELLAKKEDLHQENEKLIHQKQLEYEKQLNQMKLESEKERIQAELVAKMEIDKANEDINIRKLQMQAKLDTERNIESIRSVFQQIVQMVHTFLSQPYQVALFVGAIFALYLAYYLVKESIAALKTFIQKQLGRPSLVRETSYHVTILPKVLTLSYWGLYRESLDRGYQHITKCFDNVILSEQDKDKVIKLALTTRNTKSTNSPYRHILLYGPPGTGKTLIARKLAVASGMDYAIMSGGDVGPLGEDAVSQLHHLFKWANKSEKGLLVFIDEAEAFLAIRGASNSSDIHTRHALNALLYQTGTQSKNFLLVLATNRPEDLDPAILDRIDVTLKIDLPQYAERVLLTKLYMHEHVTRVASETKAFSILSWLWRKKLIIIAEECYRDDTVTAISEQIEGFSGREVAKMFIAVQYAMYLAPDHTLTKAALTAVVNHKVLEHKQKINNFNDEVEKKKM